MRQSEAARGVEQCDADRTALHDGRDAAALHRVGERRAEERRAPGEIQEAEAIRPAHSDTIRFSESREFVLQLKLGRSSIQYFNQKFGVDALTRFAAPIQTLKDWGFLTIEGDNLVLNRDGLLQVDRLLHEFFLPEHKNARYA